MKNTIVEYLLFIYLYVSVVRSKYIRNVRIDTKDRVKVVNSICNFAHENMNTGVIEPFVEFKYKNTVYDGIPRIFTDVVYYKFSESFLEFDRSLSLMYGDKYITNLFIDSIRKWNSVIGDRILFSRTSFEDVADLKLVHGKFPPSTGLYDNETDFAAIYTDKTGKMILHFNYPDEFNWHRCNTNFECDTNNYETTMLHMTGHIFGMHENLLDSIMNTFNYKHYNLTTLDVYNMRNAYSRAHRNTKANRYYESSRREKKRQHAIFDYYKSFEFDNKNFLCDLLQEQHVILYSNFDKLYYIFFHNLLLVVNYEMTKSVYLNLGDKIPITAGEYIVSSTERFDDLVFFTNKGYILNCNKITFFKHLALSNGTLNCDIPVKVIGSQLNSSVVTDVYGNLYIYEPFSFNLKKVISTDQSLYYMMSDMSINVDHNVLENMNIVKNSMNDDSVYFLNKDMTIIVNYNMMLRTTDSITKSAFIKNSYPVGFYNICAKTNKDIMYELIKKYKRPVDSENVVDIDYHRFL